MNEIEKLKKHYLSQVKSILIPSEPSYKSSNEFGYNNINTISAIFSSNIEGNSIDINTYFNFNSSFKNIEEKTEIDDLAKAYEFARSNPLNIANFKKAHSLLSKSSLELFQQGKFKTIPNGLFGSMGLIYLACPPDKTTKEIELLFDSINKLEGLTELEAFFYAAYIHMRIAHIHPFVDGNGRMSRLVEKWFMSEKIGNKAWYLNLEQYYFEHRQEYYKNLNIGPNYEELDYSKSLDFMLMSSKSML
jgi:Fic family protein